VEYDWVHQLHAIVDEEGWAQLNSFKQCMDFWSQKQWVWFIWFNSFFIDLL